MGDESTHIRVRIRVRSPLLACADTLTLLSPQGTSLAHMPAPSTGSLAPGEARWAVTLTPQVWVSLCCSPRRVCVNTTPGAPPRGPKVTARHCGGSRSPPRAGWNKACVSQNSQGTTRSPGPVAVAGEWTHPLRPPSPPGRAAGAGPPRGASACGRGEWTLRT